MSRRQTPVTPLLAGRISSRPAVDLSVVLPCYNAAALARTSVARLAEALDNHVGTYEIVVVHDGCGDCDGDLGSIPAGRWGGVRVVTLPRNRGKGAAVAAGMRAATGAVRIFTDIDLPYGTTPVLLVESLIRTRGLHVVIGDRTFPQSRYETELPLFRRAASAVFSRITSTLVTGGFFDTQCGIKGFRGDVANALFGLQRVERFAFDVELLYLALTYGLEIKRIPVQLESNTTSSVKLGRDSARTLADVLRIKANQLRGNYFSDYLRNLVALECSAASTTLEGAPSAQDTIRIAR